MNDFTLPCGRIVAPAAYTLTGSKRTSVRVGFTQWDEWGHVEGVRRGLVASTEGYCLDAPEQMASGASKGFIGMRDIATATRVLFVNPTYFARS